MTDITKHFSFKDSLDLKDKLIPHKSTHYRPYTEVSLFTEVDGEKKLLWTKRNMMVLAGGGFLARTLFDFEGSTSEITPNYNNALDLDETQTTSSGQTADTKVFGFCCGTDGCGLINSQVRAVKYASWINPDWTSDFGLTWGGIVPFQYRRSDSDLSSEERNVYFGRKYVNADDRYAYYFKTFDSTPTFSQRYTNGDPIDSSVYTTENGMDVETCVTMQLSVTKDDFRDFFYVGGADNSAGESLTLNDARINSISLLMGWPYVNSEGFTVYQDVRPLTMLYFPSIALIDLRLSVSLSYSIYF